MDTRVIPFWFSGWVRGQEGFVRTHASRSPYKFLIFHTFLAAFSFLFFSFFSSIEREERKKERKKEETKQQKRKGGNKNKKPAW